MLLLPVIVDLKDWEEMGGILKEVKKQGVVRMVGLIESVV